MRNSKPWKNPPKTGNALEAALTGRLLFSRPSKAAAGQNDSGVSGRQQMAAVPPYKDPSGITSQKQNRSALRVVRTLLSAAVSFIFREVEFMKNRNTMDFLAPSKTSILLFAIFPGNLSVNRMFGSPASSATPEGFSCPVSGSSSGMSV